MSRLVALIAVCLLALAPFLSPDVATAQREGNRKAPRELETGRLPAAVEVGAQAKADRPSAQDRYIVRLKDAAGDPLRVAESFAADGVVPTHVYRHVFRGFAAKIPPARLAALKRDPDVASVTPDGIARTTAELVTGVDRIDADQNSVADIDGADQRVDVDVAVIDSGTGLSHPDLNVWAFANCTDEASPDDLNGHGTHVGGSVGALDNGSGVVGVAPGARLWSFKVLNASGNGLFSWIICGMDVAAHHGQDRGDGLGDIEVANMSLGAQTTDNSACGDGTSPLHDAACRVVDAGVTLVVAAGNDAIDANGFVPATYAEAITVSALADSDGKPGGDGGPTSRGPDDTFATFSNFGADVDLAAPGVDIRSTWLNGGFHTISGTSMASPHVAGAAALYIAEHGDVGPAAVKAGLRAQREQFDMPNDPDPTAEGIVNVKNTRPDTTRPTVKITAPKAGATVKNGATIKLTAQDAGSGVKAVEVRYCAGAPSGCTFAKGKKVGPDGTAPYAVTWRGQPRNGTYTLIAKATDEAGNAAFSNEVKVTVKN